MRRRLFSALLVGVVFGVGLLWSGMANPQKVLGFLDLAGLWDPSLALVMGGAVGIGFVAFSIARRRARSVLGDPMRLPERRDIDARLVFGSIGFGIGWGLAGFCPGPALVALGAFEVKALVFVAAMLAGMAVYEWLERNRGQ